MLNLIKNLTPTQWILLIMSTAGVLNGSAAQLTDWFGPHVAHDIISGLGFAQTLIGAWAMALSGQTGLVQQVAAITGTDGQPAVRVSVNANAPASVASVALDPAQKNVGAATPEVRAQLIAKS